MLYILAVAFLKHSYMFRFLYIILRVASRYFYFWASMILRVYRAYCKILLYLPNECYIYIGSGFLKTLLHVSIFIHHRHQDHF